MAVLYITCRSLLHCSLKSLSTKIVCFSNGSHIAHLHISKTNYIHLETVDSEAVSFVANLIEICHLPSNDMHCLYKPKLID